MNEENTSNPLADVHANSIKETIKVQEVEEAVSDSNYLSDVHSGKVVPVVETEEKRNHYGSEVVPDDALGNVPDELPTQLGGVIMENVEEPSMDATDATDAPESENGDVTSVNY